MKLISLTLENIKSYVKETISFYDGVNFISGPNGAGKSTIIEAVGYALFDSNPFSAIRQFIREGEKSGVISVVIEARDERLYRVERRLRQPSGGSWTVYDVESETELSELHGSQDVKSWLGENLGVKGELDSAMLFEDVIGVSQGRFTTPFLERGARRKDIFNAILQLETYRQAFEKSSRLTGVFGQRLAETNGERSRLLDKTEDLDQCRHDLLETKEKKENIDGEIILLNSKLMEVERAILFQEKKKEHLDAQEQKLQGISIYLENLHSNEERLLNELGLAGTAMEKLKTAEPGYRKYLRLQAEIKIIEAKRRDRDNYQHSYQAILNSTSALEAEINSDKENRTRQAALYEAEKAELLSSGKETARLKEELEKCLEIKREKWEAYEDYIIPIKQLEAVLHRYTIGQSMGKNLYQSWLGVVEEMNRLEKELAYWELLESQVKEAPVLDKELASVQEELGTVKARLQTLNESLLDAAGGLCPFLQTSCSNIEGSLEVYFQKEIAILTPGLEELQSRKDQLEISLQKVRKSQQQILTLQVKQEQFNNLQKKEAELSGELEREREALLKEFNPQVITDLKAGWGLIKGLLLALKGFSELVSPLEEEINSIDRHIKDYENSYQELAELDNSCLNKVIAALVSIIEDLRDSGLNLKGRIEKTVQNMFEEEGQKVAVLEARVTDLRERYKKVNNSLLELQNIDALEIKEEKLRKLYNNAQEIKASLDRFEGLDKSWELVNTSLTNYESDYQQFLQNQELAGKVKSLEEELKNLSLEKERLSKEMDHLQGLIQDLKLVYLPEELIRMRLERDLFKENKARLTSEMSVIKRDLERLEKSIAEKEKTLQKILSLEKRLKELERAQNLLQQMRSVLNQSGDKMAQIYRDFLGREADLLYQQVAKENVHLTWGEDYEIMIRDSIEGKERERNYSQLSGGEKMTAALAVRLALLKYLSALGIGFFDEPTANLDDRRRTNLARIIPEITRNFRQVFVISHDDTFDAITENVIILKKEIGTGSTVSN